MSADAKENDKWMKEGLWKGREGKNDKIIFKHINKK